MNESVPQKVGKDIAWWENMQTTAMRLAYIVFSVPALYGIVNVLQNGSLGDPLSAGFHTKLWLGFALLVLILIFPAYIQLKLKKLRSIEEAGTYSKRVKPFPVDTPVYLYLLSFILLPYSMTYVWLGILSGVSFIVLSEVYIRKAR